MQGLYQKALYTGVRAFSNHALSKIGFRPVDTEGANTEEERKKLGTFFHKTSEESIRARFHQQLSLEMRARYAEQLLGKVRDREAIAYVAESEGSRVIGVGEAHKIDGSDDAEISVMVDDEYRRSGVGSKLAEKVENDVRQERTGRLHAHVQDSNQDAKKFFRAQGYKHDFVSESWTKKL